MVRKRVVTSKPTRDGCKTCRLRRIKCDETRPRCFKCTSLRRECDFGVRTLPVSTSRALLPASQWRCPPDSSNITALRGLSPNTPELTSISSFANAEDRRAYEFFLNVSLDEIGSTSPSGSEWIRVALQHIALKPIFHAIAAVGRAHGSIYRVSHFTLARMERPSELCAAMVQYGKAVSALQHYIKEVVEKQAAVEPVLIACLLLTCYEILIDRKGTAFSHYRLGRTIVEQVLSMTSARSGASSPSMSTVNHLAAAFRSLGRGGEHYWREFEIASKNRPSIQYCTPGSLPAAFTSCVEADVHLEAIVRLGEELRNEMIQLAQARIRGLFGESLDIAVSFCLANCLSKGIIMTANLQHRLQGVFRAHVRWQQTLQAHILEQRPAKDQILLLTQIRYFASWLVVSTCRETSEVAIDRFEDDFVRILDMAETYFEHFSAEPLPKKPPHLREAIGLSLEGGILPALHLIACKSRSSAIRRRAAEMLVVADRQEGTCHSGIIGLTARCAADLEEGRARVLQMDPIQATSDFTADQVPEQARFADSVIEGGPGLPPKFKLVCARYPNGEDGKIEVLEYHGEGLPVNLCFVGARTFDCAKESSRMECV